MGGGRAYPMIRGRRMPSGGGGGGGYGGEQQPSYDPGAVPLTLEGCHGGEGTAGCHHLPGREEATSAIWSNSQPACMWVTAYQHVGRVPFSSLWRAGGLASLWELSPCLAEELMYGVDMYVLLFVSSSCMEDSMACSNILPVMV